MTITIDEDLVSRAQQVLGTRTKSQTIRRALSELLRREALARTLTHRGSVELELDQPTLERLRADG